MKRILALVLCAAFLAGLSATAVSAQEISAPYMNGYSTVEYTNPSNYAVVIPETIDGNQPTLSFEATHMNLKENEAVEVYSDGGNIIELTSTETEDIAEYHITVDDLPVAVFENGELTSPVIYPWVSNSNEIAAAHYSGTITFRIRLVEN